jgi:hypothetical protein
MRDVCGGSATGSGLDTPEATPGDSNVVIVDVFVDVLLLTITMILLGAWAGSLVKLPNGVHDGVDWPLHDDT